MGQLCGLVCVDSVLLRIFKIFSLRVASWRNQLHQVDQAHHPIIIAVALLDEHVTVLLTDDQVVVSKECDEVKRVQLAATTHVYPLKDIH